MRSLSPDPCRRPGRAGLLAPWLLAPAWVFLPLLGCGLAESALKPSRASGVAADRAVPAAGMSVVPVGSTMTVAAAPLAPR